MADANNFPNNFQESIETIVSLGPELPGGWIPIANIIHYLPENIDFQQVFEVKKDGYMYCKSEQALKVMEEHIILKMRCDGSNHL